MFPSLSDFTNPRCLFLPPSVSPSASYSMALISPVSAKKSMEIAKLYVSLVILTLSLLMHSHQQGKLAKHGGYRCREYVSGSLVTVLDSRSTVIGGQSFIHSHVGFWAHPSYFVGARLGGVEKRTAESNKGERHPVWKESFVL